ncbi:MAG: hydroxymethylbilane synthase [Bdellovibrionota bacterium]
MSLKLGTRASALAMIQANWFKDQWEKRFPHNPVLIEKIQTQGDRNQTQSQAFAHIQENGLFTKELDEALLEHRIDIAVHSLKDLPSVMPKGIKLAAVSTCIDNRDAWISSSLGMDTAQTKTCVIGTASIRRLHQLQEEYPSATIKTIRGNVDTRLKKLANGECDVLILAAAGLKRLGLDHHIREYLDPMHFVPAIGQGRLGICIRDQDISTQQSLESIFDSKDLFIAKVEKAFLSAFGGGCSIPVGCFAWEDQKTLYVQSYYFHPEKQCSYRKQWSCESSNIMNHIHHWAIELKEGRQ